MIGKTLGDSGSMNIYSNIWEGFVASAQACKFCFSTDMPIKASLISKNKIANFTTDIEAGCVFCLGMPFDFVFSMRVIIA